MKVIVGSKNPVKINAVKFAFEAIWPEKDFEVEGLEVESGVAEQPMTDLETYTGARNRAYRVLEQTDADYAVGLEGGLQKFENKWFSSGWVVVVDRSGKEGVGTTIRITIPDNVISKISEGDDLGAATDRVFNRTNVKQQEGIYGILTKNALTRTSAFKDGVAAALAPFAYPELMPEKPSSAEEEIDIVDEVNNVLYTTTKGEAHEKGLLHRTVIGGVRTSDGRICLVRQTSDRQDPGQYVSPVGGHVKAGETEDDALIREAEEEIGVTDIKFKLLGRKIFNREVLGRKENHYFIVYEIFHDGELNLGDESDAYEYFTPEQLIAQMQNTPEKFGDAYKFVHKNFYD